MMRVWCASSFFIYQKKRLQNLEIQLWITINSKISLDAQPTTTKGTSSQTNLQGLATCKTRFSTASKELNVRIDTFKIITMTGLVNGMNRFLQNLKITRTKKNWAVETVRRLESCETTLIKSKKSWNRTKKPASIDQTSETWD